MVKYDRKKNIRIKKKEKKKKRKRKREGFNLLAHNGSLRKLL
jgi:hypothetical protein